MLKRLKHWFNKNNSKTNVETAKKPLNFIGYFQFDNLVQNRVPFVLYNLGPDLKDHYQSIYKVHLEKHQQLVTKQSALTDLKEKNHALTTAIILVCEDGKTSSELYLDLENAGYTNVYVIDGGYQQMMTEKGST